ncbi:YraN family protein [Marinigracilibium pacificum]|uniref:UPF0102 protein HH304_15235 n=1 Tax=Marinigracilibium pacificum TaxID=2729599 RepID=A0A848J5G4_9BACT|nr:YraN family protein [Marinigracilibium pacificum]NMM49760.1 YraN family protein [Marinigracilibium pacificum]
MERNFNRNRQIGNKGEEKAALFLRSLGFDIIETNYRYSHSEIDIIALKDCKIHFIEVKTRTSDQYGEPEEAIDDSKLESMMSVADHYVDKIDWNGNIQFDAISILLKDDIRLDYFEDIC